MQERKDNVRVKLRKGVEALLKFSKVELVIGTAEIIDRYNVKVGKEVYTTKTIILATGSTPIMLPLPGFDKAIKAGVMIDSTGALDLKEIPKSLTVVGGGVIGLEFAMLYNELGTKVTILEGGPNILGPMDVDVRKYAEALASSEGIDVKTNVKVTGYDAKGLLFEEDGKTHSIKSDKILLSVGRKVNNLGLDKSLGIKVNQKGAFEVNENLQTSIDNIFAIGDVTGQVMLAHVAYKHAHVIEDLFKGRPNAFDRLKVPACVYTHPELSSIGYTEQELKELKIDYQKTVFQNQHIGRVLAEGKDDKGFTKLLIDKKYGKILGAHIINANSSDMIAEIALNMQLEGTIFELADTIHPHPSIAEGIYEAAVHAVRQFRSGK